MKPALLELLRCPVCPGLSARLALAAAPRPGGAGVARRPAPAPRRGRAPRGTRGRVPREVPGLRAPARAPRGALPRPRGAGRRVRGGALHLARRRPRRRARRRGGCLARGPAARPGRLPHPEDSERASRAIVRPLTPGGLVTIFVYGRRTLPWVIWPLRRWSLRADRERVRRLCDADGFGYDPARRPRLAVGRALRRLGRLDVLGLGRVTYEGLTTPYLREHSLGEVRRWFAETRVEVLSSTRQVSASGRLVGEP